MSKDLLVNILKAYLSSTLERYHESGGINKDALIVIGFICFAKILIIDIIFGRSGQLICHFIGFAYPAYRTTKAIESNRNGDDNIDKIQWLMYWVVFASFHLVEFFSDTILGWMPMYWICKSIFLLACMSPLNLCSVMYHTIVLPLFKQSEAIIDTFAADCRAYALNQCHKSLSLDTNYGHLQLEALSESVDTFQEMGIHKSYGNANKEMLNTNSSTRFEELEFTTYSTSTNSCYEDDTRLRDLEMISDSVLQPSAKKQNTTGTRQSPSIDTSNKAPELCETISFPNLQHTKSIPDNAQPRPSPKKKKAPPPPKQKLSIEEEDKINKYLDDHF